MLHRDVSPTTLGAARIAVYGMWLFHVVRDPLTDYARFAGGLLEPIGPLRLLPVEVWQALCTRPGLAALRGAMIAGLALCVAGVGPFRPIAAFTCALLVAYQGLIRGVGYIQHGELPMLFAAIVLAAFPCADGLAPGRGRPVDRDPVLYRAPMVAGALALCATYVFIGARRFESGGLGILFDGTILRWIAARGAERGGIGLEVVADPWLARLVEVGFVVVTACEVLAPLALFHAWFRRAWIAVMVGFHVGTAVLMGISFRANFVLIALFLTDSDRWIGHLLDRLRRRGPDQGRAAGPAVT